MEHTKESLFKGLEQVKPGQRIGDIGHAVEEYALAHNLGVVKELCGHGVGTEVHEDPEVFTSKDTKVFIADFQTENNRQGIFETLCNHVQEKLHLLQRFLPDTFSNIIKWCISHADLHHFAHQSDSNHNAF